MASVTFLTLTSDQLTLAGGGRVEDGSWVEAPAWCFAIRRAILGLLSSLKSMPPGQ